MKYLHNALNHGLLASKAMELLDERRKYGYNWRSIIYDIYGGNRFGIRTILVNY